jgi:signal transduction histidine kinase
MTFSLALLLFSHATNSMTSAPQNKIVDFRLTVEQDQVVFVISDHGIGIPDEDLEHLFGAFHRGKNVGILPGTGLGLSIVKNCIDIHDGSISVESQLDIGTKFTVVLPISGEGLPDE